MNNRGYTMIELMFVLLIISMLITVSMPFYKKAAEKGGRVTTLQEMRHLQQALHSYWMDHKTYPATLDDPTFLRTPNDSDGGYIEHHPEMGIDVLRDSWGNLYKYSVGDSAKDGYIRSDGADGKPDTADDLTVYLMFHR